MLQRVVFVSLVVAAASAFVPNSRSPPRRGVAARARPLTEENVLASLAEARQELQQLFGYTAENRQVGITGEVDLVELDGPTVVLRLSGRFWHERSTVLARVGNFLQDAIPEICDVAVEDPSQLDDADQRVSKPDF